ncbi:MAG: hypothetical protein M3328_14815, partial [Chloroflexota bacterium]|nr:hypothetical protein [Chloroflexota bacterium]
MGQGGVQVGDMDTYHPRDVGGAGGLAQLPGPHRGAGIAPQVGGHASPRRGGVARPTLRAAFGRWGMGEPV